MSTINKFYGRRKLFVNVVRTKIQTRISEQSHLINNYIGLVFGIRNNQFGRKSFNRNNDVNNRSLFKERLSNSKSISRAF